MKESEKESKRWEKAITGEKERKKMAMEAKSADERVRKIERETTIYIYVITLSMREWRERE